MLAATVGGLSSCFRASISRAHALPNRTLISSAKHMQNRASRVADKVGTKPSSLREKLMAPAGNNAFGIGRGVVAGTAAAGLGALCFYGSGFGGHVGIREKAMVWPQYVKDRVRTTYVYFGGSLAISAATALAVFRSPLIKVVAAPGWMPAIIGLGLMMGSGMVAQSIPYSEGFGAKQLAWMVHSGVIGGVLAPLCFAGGPILIRAAAYTAGIVGGLSAIAVCAPSEKFLNWGAPLGMGLGLVVVANIGSIFLPPTTVLGAGLYSITVYGGLALFSGLMLYDTQKVVKRAEITPPNSVHPYDPINNAISIYLDAVNIFVRMVMILGNGGKKK